MNKTLKALAVAAVCISGLAALQLPRLRSQLTQSAIDSETLQTKEALQRDRLILWQTMPSFGFDNLIADWTFLNFLQYFGNTESRQVVGYTALPEFFQVIVQRDPYFRLSYQFLSSSVTLFAGQPEETINLLEQGLSHMTPTFPEDSYWLWRYKAVDELLFLGDTAAAIDSFEQAVIWASQSPAPEADRSAATAQRIVDFLRQDPDSRQVRASSWMMIWSNAINEGVRQYAEEQLEALGYRVRREENRLQLEDTLPDSKPALDSE